MNYKVLIKVYNVVCRHYVYIASVVLILTLVTLYVVGYMFEHIFMFSISSFSYIEVGFYLVGNMCIILLSHWIINKKLKRNFICIIWVLPLMIQVLNLVKVLIF